MTTPRIRRSPYFLPLTALTGLTLLAAGAATWLLWPQTRPTARVQLFAQSDPLVPPPRGEAFLRNQAYIIHDRFVLSAALRDPSVARLSVVREQADPLGWLENEIRVDFPGPEFIQISMSGEHADQLLTIVKAVRKAYLEKTGDKELAEREATLKMLEDIRAGWEKRTKANRKRLCDLQLENCGMDINNLALVRKIVFEELADAQKALVRLRPEIRRLRAEIGLKPNWRAAFWPRYLEALNATPASASPLGLTHLNCRDSLQHL